MGWTLLAPIVARLFKDASWWLLIAGVCLVGAIVLRRAFAPAPPLPTAFGTTTAVHRGNAMSVKVGWRTREVVLHGIAVPDGLWGERATAFLRQLVYDKQVRLEITDGRGVSARMTAIVYTPEGWCANAELLKQGLAWCTDNRQREWRRLEADAQRNNRGIWQQYKRVEGDDAHLYAR